MPQINDHRWEGVWRVVVGLPFLVVLWFIGIFILIFFLLWMVIDVTIQILLDREGLMFGRGWAERLFEWLKMNSRYVLFGDGGYQILP